ncbi:type II toxin-antitoxin system HicB family antitoxin [Microcoleus sp. PH2017_28_MFU_U_A]|uniref:type II toxin-antitoxin system HicB family antitoxin n=2 Tax=Microcoleus TaxID=44471 RepID=UPI002D7EFD04|nr:type II toxin-antitoxin system HicB family antitoxin [Microcoleus sp. PH2017_28_MFU_U_A]
MIVRSPQIIYNRKVSARDTEIMNIKVVLEPSEEGGYTVYVPSLSGCISEGETIDEALANIQEAIELYLEPMADELSISEGAIVRELVV